MPAPTLANPTSANITPNSATFGGEVTGDGGNAITARGIVFALTTANANPQIGGDGVTNLPADGAIGVFTMNATGLQAGQAYSFAAYATNSDGTSYTPVATFTTVNLPGPPAPPLGAPAIHAAPPPGNGGGEPPPQQPPPPQPQQPDHFLVRMVKSIATLPALATVVLLFLIAIVSFFVYKTPRSGDPVNYARGLITVLFATGTMAIAFILTISALLSDSTDFEKRFDKAKEVLTIMIGIFGTILGFYFGTATNVPPAESIKLSLSGPLETTAIKKGETATIKISLKHSGGRYQGNVKLSVENLPNGFKTEFTSDTIKPADTGEVGLKVTVDNTVKPGIYMLRITGIPDSGTVSPVDVKIEVVE